MPSGTVEVTNEELARLIAEGFAHTASKEQVERLEKGQEDLARRLGMGERKLDSVLVNDVDRHEREIKFLADKVGVELSR